MKNLYSFTIDVVGVCNLKCPSCPQSGETRLPKGMMTPELLEKILTKAQAECDILNVALYDWGEPLLNPHLPELIGIVHRHGLDSLISSNLNRSHGIKEMMEAEPAEVRISCSGFVQENYKRTHSGGNIETVKANMELVKQHRRGKTRVYVYWHRYQHNAADGKQMAALCEKLGFDFEPYEAYMMPVEKVIARWTGERKEPDEVESLLLTPLAEHQRLVASKKDYKCSIQHHVMTLNHLGQVQLCCAVFDPDKFTLCDYLTTPIEEIQRRRFAHDYCGTCASHGAHAYAQAYTHRDQSHLAESLKTAYARWGYKIVPPKIAFRVKEALS